MPYVHLGLPKHWWKPQFFFLLLCFRIYNSTFWVGRNYLIGYLVKVIVHILAPVIPYSNAKNRQPIILFNTTNSSNGREMHANKILLNNQMLQVTKNWKSIKIGRLGKRKEKEKVFSSVLRLLERIIQLQQISKPVLSLQGLEKSIADLNQVRGNYHDKRKI